jgi:sirohydrochlorin ferrochelatase
MKSRIYMNQTRYVVAAHGSSSPEANESIRTLAAALECRLGAPVGAAFLERAEPSIPAALRRAHVAGASRIVMLPFFLMPGMHVRRDLEALAAQVRSETGADIVVTEYLGAHPDVVALLVDLANGASTVPSA